ncbi:MAG: fibronectin type III domain-containing protein [Acidobacteriota bacterium]
MFFKGLEASPAKLGWFSVAVLAMLVVASTGCGKKGPPKPPPSKIPNTITDLKVQQRGMEILLRMAYPTTTIGGLPLETVQAVDIWEMKRIIPAFTGGLETSLDEPVDESAADYVGEPEAEETETTLVEDVAEIESPEEEVEGLLFQVTSEDVEDTEVAKEDQIEVDPREFELVSRLVWSAQDDELQSAVLGDTLVARIPIEALTEVEEIHVFGARVYASDKLVSATSNLVKLLPQEPLPPPEDLSVEPSQRGVKISWTSPAVEGSTDDEEDSLEPKGFNVYRREAEVRQYGLPIFTAPETVESYTDTTATFDRQYIYTVTTISSKVPLIESAIGAEYEVNYKDRFEPEPPRELTALPEQNQIRLLWELSTSEDVVGYRVFRQDPGGEFQEITTEPLAGSEYLDRNLPGGQTYGYYVVAVDGAENQSEASDTVEARVP